MNTASKRKPLRERPEDFEEGLEDGWCATEKSKRQQTEIWKKGGSSSSTTTYFPS